MYFVGNKMSDNFEKLKHLLFPRKVRVESLLALKQGISLTDHPTRYYKISFYFSHSLHINKTTYAAIGTESNC